MKKQALASLLALSLAIVLLEVALPSIFYSEGQVTSNWQFQTIDPVKVNNMGTCLKLDLLGNPHIVYFSSSSYGIMSYAAYNGTSWSTQTVDTSVMQFAMAFDSCDSPYIAYITNSLPSSPKIAHLVDSQWSIQDIGTSGQFSSISICVNLQDVPIVSYCDLQSHNLMFAQYNGESWETTAVNSTGDFGSSKYSYLYNSISIDNTGNPHISYYNAANSILMYASRKGSTWTTEPVHFGLGQSALYNSLGIDTNNRPHIAFFDWQNNLVKYAYHNDSGWQVESVISSTRLAPCVLALDNNDSPRIAYAHTGITLASRNSSGWSLQTITNPDESFMYTPSLAFSNQNVPHISYVGQQSSSLYARYASPLAGQCQITFSQTGIKTDYTQVVLNVDGVEHSVQDLPITFNWSTFSSHTFSFIPVADTGIGKRYVLAGSSGLSPHPTDSLTVTGSGIITASFKTQYKLNVSSALGNPTGEGWYDSGATATFGVTSPISNAAATRNVFTNWIGTGVGSINTTASAASVVMNNPIAETANWKTQYLVSYLAIPPEAGTTTPTGSNQWADKGTTAITASTNSEYYFSSWYSASNSSLFTDSAAQVTTVAINGPDTIIASFTTTPLSSYVFKRSIGCSYPRGIAVDSSGNMYVTETGNNRIQKFSSSGTPIISWGSYGAGNGQFNNPTGIAIDNLGNVYVADRGNGRIQKFTTSGAFLTKWGVSGTGEGEFNNPLGITVDNAGNVYVTEEQMLRVQKFNNSGAFLSQWNTQFASWNLAADALGNIYLSGGNCIGKYNSLGSLLAVWGQSGLLDGQFDQPMGVAVDGSGNVYVVEYNSNRVQKFSSSGTFLTKWGTLGSGDGQLCHAWGIAVDSSGNVYVADSSNSRIQVFEPSSNNQHPSPTPTPTLPPGFSVDPNNMISQLSTVASNGSQSANFARGTSVKIVFSLRTLTGAGSVIWRVTYQLPDYAVAFMISGSASVSTDASVSFAEITLPFSSQTGIWQAHLQIYATDGITPFSFKEIDFTVI